MALTILIIINIYFILIWFYYVLLSFKFKNQNIRTVIRIYGLLFCKKNEVKSDELSEEVNSIDKKVDEKAKPVRAKKKKSGKKMKIKRRIRGKSKRFLSTN